MNSVQLGWPGCNSIGNCPYCNFLVHIFFYFHWFYDYIPFHHDYTKFKLSGRKNKVGKCESPVISGVRIVTRVQLLDWYHTDLNYFTFCNILPWEVILLQHFHKSGDQNGPWGALFLSWKWVIHTQDHQSLLKNIVCHPCFRLPCALSPFSIGSSGNLTQKLYGLCPA